MKNRLFRLFSFAVIIVLIVCINPVYANALDITDYAGEKITLPEADGNWEKITISNVSDFAALAQRCKLDSASEHLYVVLSEDISFNDTEVTPIPYFKGIFEGNGHTISGVTGKNTSEPVGLFSSVGEGGVVKNLNVTGALQPSENCNYIGGIVGKNSGIIYKCTFEGVVVGNNYAGGIAGENCLGGVIALCTVKGAVRGDNMTGGIVGINEGFITVCKNYALINTESVDGGIDIANLDIDFTLDLARLTSQGTSSMQDMGGICGYSSGSVFDCTNYGEVGYNHQGYNIGGIIGRSSGYVLKCTNEAHIYGRKDIGGIIGQMEPYVEVSEAESRISVLNTQIDEMQELMEITRDHAYNAGSDATKRIDNILEKLTEAQESASGISQNITDEYDSVTNSSTKEKADSATQYVKDNISKEDINKDNINENRDELSQNQDDLDNALKDINSELEQLNNEAKGYGNLLDSDLDKINAKYSEINDTFESFKEINLGVEDTSTIDPDLVIFGAVKECVNNGEVEGDLNAGGIVGAMGEESSVDPEDEISLSVDFETYKEYEYKAVLIDCVNYGSVFTKRNYAGGVAARAEIGFIKGCENYGAVSAEGNYVGGIVAESAITIEKCYSKAFLSGTKHVGGIIGAGINESANGAGSLVSDCRSYVTIENASKFYGAVSGSPDGNYENNIFTSDRLYGLGAYSADKKAYAVSYEELIAGDDTPSDFKKLTVYFLAGDTLIKSADFKYNDRVSADVYPSIPAKSGCFAKWDIEEITNIKADTRVNVIYSDYIAAIASEEARLSGRPVFYAEGDFSEQDELMAYLYPEGVLSVEEYGNDSFFKKFYAREVEEYWKIEIPDDGRNVHTLRYLPTGASAKTPEIYIYKDGQFTLAVFTEIGSYYVFETDAESIGVAIVALKPVYYTFALAFAAVVAVLVVISFVISIIGSIKKKKKKAESSSEDNKEIKKSETETEAETKECTSDTEEDKSDIEEINLSEQDAETSEKEKKPESEENKAKHKKKKHRVIRFILKLLLLIILAGVVALTVYLSKNPEIIYGKVAYAISMRVANMDSLSFDSVITVSTGDETEETHAHVNTVKKDGSTYAKIETNGAVIYKCGDRMILESGKAFEISECVPAYENIFALLPSIIGDTRMGAERVDGGTRRSFALSNEMAGEVIRQVLGEYSSRIASVENASIVLLSANWNIKTATLKGSVILTNGERAVIECVITMTSDEEETVIPDAVIEGASSEAPAVKITPEMLDLVYAYGRFNSKDPSACDVELIAKGEILTVGSDLTWFRVREDGDRINCVTKNGVALYYNENGACTSKGVSLADAQKEVVETAKLMDAAYELCMKGNLVILQDKNTVTYRLDMDEETMSDLLSVMAPEMDEVDKKLTSGTIYVYVRDGEISDISINVSGSVKLVNLERSFGVTVKAVPTSLKAGYDYKIPTEVLAALNGK